MSVEEQSCCSIKSISEENESEYDVSEEKGDATTKIIAEVPITQQFIKTQTAASSFSDLENSINENPGY